MSYLRAGNVNSKDAVAVQEQMKQAQGKLAEEAAALVADDEKQS